MTFNQPEYLVFFIALPLLIIIHFFSLKYTRRKALKFANFNVIEKITGKKIISKNWTLLFLRMFIFSCLILSTAGTHYWYNTRGSDFDYGLLIDTSASMMAKDYEPNRLNAAKDAALEFVDAVGKGTNLGLVTFTGTTFLKQRLIDDTKIIREEIKAINVESVGGTAIGDVLVTGTNLFFSEEGGSNVLVLLTDGQNNVGLDPQEAIRYLLDSKVMVYTIGIGTQEGGSFVGDVGVSRLDEESLKFIAEETGGEYFHAEDTKELRNAFKKILNLKMRRISQDLTLILLVIALSVLLLEWGLMNSKYRSLP